MISEDEIEKKAKEMFPDGGHRLASLPRHSFKLGAKWAIETLKESEKEKKEELVKTLRDEFAMAAINGFLGLMDKEAKEHLFAEFLDLIPAACYKLADKMLEEREKND